MTIKNKNIIKISDEYGVGAEKYKSNLEVLHDKQVMVKLEDILK